MHRCPYFVCFSSSSSFSGTVGGQSPAPFETMVETVVCWFSQANHHARVS